MPIGYNKFKKFEAEMNEVDDIYHGITILKRYSRLFKIPMMAFSTGVKRCEDEGGFCGNRILAFLSPRTTYSPMLWLTMLALQFSSKFENAVVRDGIGYVFICFAEEQQIGSFFSWYSGTRQSDFTVPGEVDFVPAPLFYDPFLVAGEMAMDAENDPPGDAELNDRK